MSLFKTVLANVIISDKSYLSEHSADLHVSDDTAMNKLNKSRFLLLYALKV